MTNAPAFQFYPRDWIASQRIQLMSMEEEGAYIRLLCHCWLHGSIPADEQQAIKLLGKGGYNLAITTVLTMFQPGPEPGTLVHDRLEAERRKQANWRAKSVAGGQKSAEQRWHKPSDNQQLDKGCLPNGDNQTVTLQSAVCSLQSAKNTNTYVGRNGAPDDAAWLLSLASDPAYAGIDTATEVAKCRRWCETNRKQASRRRIVNWLNRVDKPIGQTASRPKPNAYSEPPGWQGAIIERYPATDLAEKVRAGLPWLDVPHSVRTELTSRPP